MKTDSPYLRNVTTIKENGNYLILTHHRTLRQKGWEKETIKSKRGTAHNKKSPSNVANAKSKLRKLATLIEWEWWCTFTIDGSKYNRYDLKTYKKDLLKFFSNMNRYRKENKITYLLVFGLHKDGAWHAHALLNGLAKEELFEMKVSNENILTWEKYNLKFGFSYICPLTAKERRINYMIKNINHVIARVDNLNIHLLYHSQRLLPKDSLVYCGTGIILKENIPWNIVNADGHCKSITFSKSEHSLDEFCIFPENDL